MKNLRLVEVNTTAYEEENFVLVTDLTDEQIQEVIIPIVEKERNSDNDDIDSFYDNQDLIDELRETYPNNTIIYYTTSCIELLSI